MTESGKGVVFSMESSIDNIIPTVKAEELNEKELLIKILEENKKRTFYSRISAIAAVSVFAAIAVCLLLVVPQLFTAVNNVNDALAVAGVTLAEAENAAAGLTKMSNNITKVSEAVDKFVTENSAALSEAMTDIGSIDYEGLNKAIRDLQAAVEPFANFMNRFK